MEQPKNTTVVSADTLKGVELSEAGLWHVYQVLSDIEHNQPEKSLISAQKIADRGIPNKAKKGSTLLVEAIAVKLKSLTNRGDILRTAMDSPNGNKFMYGHLLNNLDNQEFVKNHEINRKREQKSNSANKADFAKVNESLSKLTDRTATAFSFIAKELG